MMFTLLKHQNGNELWSSYLCPNRNEVGDTSIHFVNVSCIKLIQERSIWDHDQGAGQGVPIQESSSTTLSLDAFLL